ncbi:MAG: ABC transporter ATP-binding protein [Candidatus Sulfotelmatobacter sp.]
MGSYPFLECRRVTKSFGGRRPFQALAEVTFSVEEGELLGVRGASGSGKTTLLTIIGGLQQPTSGEVILKGRALESLAQDEAAKLRAQNIGFIFQSPALVPVLGAGENVEYGLQLARPELSGDQRRRLVEEALEITNLESCKSLRPGQLSGGECQRVAIARAVVKRPALLLADEPTSSLDDENAATVKAVFEQLRAQHRSTIVIATHDARVLSFDTRVITLQGRGVKRTDAPTIALAGMPQ